MKYMLLIYSPEASWTKEEWTQCANKSAAICHELAAKGQFITASPLHPVATAKSVRVRNGERLVTDGPFAETTEQLGGYYLLNVEHLDEAIAIAAQLPPVKKGVVEIRPVFPLEGLPQQQLSRVESNDGLRRTKFMFLCYDNETAWEQAGPTAKTEAMQNAVELTQELAAKGQFLSASPLHPVSTATSVRVRNGQRLVSDGPFAETREVMGGYYLILAKDQSEAVDIAARHPGNRFGGVEVRQVFELSNLPEFTK